MIGILILNQRHEGNKRADKKERHKQPFVYIILNHYDAALFLLIWQTW